MKDTMQKNAESNIFFFDIKVTERTNKIFGKHKLVVEITVMKIYVLTTQVLLFFISKSINL